MSKKWISKKDNNGNVKHIPIKDEKLYNAYLKSQERSKELKKLFYAQRDVSERQIIADRLEWFMRDKADRDAFFAAEKLLQNVNTDDELRALLNRVEEDLEKQFDYDKLKKETAKIFRNHNLTEEDKRNALKFTYYEYYVYPYLYTIAVAYAIKHDRPQPVFEPYEFDELHKRISDKVRREEADFLYPFPK